MVHIWLRAETKANERRTALTPKYAQELLDLGFEITVEQSVDRIYGEKDFASLKSADGERSVKIVRANSWVDGAPQDAFVLGLKELDETKNFALKHRHIMFAHCYKNQDGWRSVLKRFIEGQGTLLDLEFLIDDNGRRVAAFGHYAGVAGVALGIMLWIKLQQGDMGGLGKVESFPNLELLVENVQSSLKKSCKRCPKVMVMGANGRCGRGCVEFAKAVGIPNENILRWDIQETSLRAGPYDEILEHDIFVNCIYLSSPVSPFLTLKQIEKKKDKKLEVIVDVSCDPNNPNNPIPVYKSLTTFDKPTTTTLVGDVKVIAIDHLPTFLPRESSDAFCHDLLDSLKKLTEYPKEPVWSRAIQLYKEKSKLSLEVAEAVE